jgi:4-amino-4-deoxy-L-arabinose transferase-like glycosyltransferase
MSKMIGWNPLNVLSTDLPYLGKTLQILPYETTHPLLVPYFIKIVTALFGESEIALHLSFIIFPLIALFSLVALNRALFPDSRGTDILLVLFFFSIPAFLVNSHNLMADVPTLAFLLLSMALYADSLEKGRKGLSYLGGISLCLAVFTSYHVMAFVPLVFIYAAMKKRLNIHTVLSLSIPVIVLLSWLLVVYALYDTVFLFKNAPESTQSNISGYIRVNLILEVMKKKIIYIIALVGSSVMFLLPAYHIIRGSFLKFIAGMSLTTLLCYSVVFKLTGYSLYENVFLSSLVALGILSLYSVVSALIRKVTVSNRARNVFLLLWVLAVMGYCIFVFTFGAARYVLPLFVPIVLVIINGAAWDFSNWRNRVVISCAVSLSVLFGYACAYSDHRYADTYRNFADEIKDFRSNASNTFDVWFIGEWGMLYYMDRANSKVLSADSNAPKKGDFVIVPEIPRLWTPSKLVTQRLRFYADRQYSSMFPLRIFNRKSHAGFYSHKNGLLPFSISREPDEVFVIYEVFID